MKDEPKTKAQLVREVRLFRARVERLQKCEEKRRRTEQSLREIEDRYYAIVDNADDAILLTAPDGRILSANPAACKMFRRTEAELCRVGRSGIVDETDPRVAHALAERIRTGKFKGELNHLRKDGTIFPADVSTTVFKDSQGIEQTSMIIRDITDRKLAEEEIINLARFPSENPIPILRLSKDGTVLYANKASEVLLKEWGCSAGGCTPTSWLEIITQALRSQSRRTIEIKLGEQTYSFVITPLFDADYVNIYGIDITDRKRTEEELRQSIAWQEEIFEGSRDPIFIADSQSHFVAVNRAACDLTGYAREELLKMRIADLHEEEDLAAYNQFRNRIMAGEPIVSEASIRRKDGIKVHTDFSNSRVIIAGIPYMHTTARDISTRKRTEEALLGSESKYRQLIEASHDVIYVVDLEERITFVNQAVRRVYGYEPEELVGHYYGEFVTPEQLEKNKAFGRKVWADGGAIVDYENEFLRKDGTPIILNTNAVFLRDKQGTIVGSTGIARDITENRRADRELKRSTTQLRALAAHLQSIREDERTNLARELHDELGQLLTGLKMELSFLDKTPTNQDSIRPQDLRNAKVDSMNELIDKAIGAVRGISLELRPAILDSLGLSAALEWLANDFQQKSGIDCSCSIKTNAAFDSQCSTAMFRITQEALTNILRHSQAKKAGITFAGQPNEVTLSICDDGIGMKTEKTSDVRSLGLLGIRERAAAIGGTIEIDSRVGTGTTVRLRIPLSDRKDSALRNPDA